MLLTIEKVIILKSINLFSEIPESDLLKVAMKLEPVECETGSVIIKQGDIGSSMYIVVRGEVDVDINGQVVTTLGEKNIFGELSVLDPEPRSATIITTKETLLFKISSDLIYDLISEHTDVARGILRILCQRLRESN
ncbi:MAG: cyclic nucleotide-binding domain-containing protein [Campylobacterota bacterium]|nr:cyclic nucleotide-binding domain-containing protein [Campylobacterota bacterium]